MDMTNDLHRDCRAEVLELHRFFQGWFRGGLADTEEVFARFADVIARDFVMVTTRAGVMTRVPLLDGVRQVHGKDPAAQIRIENFTGREVGPGLFQATYEEWQGEGATRRGRRSSALFRRREGLAQGVEWLHLHETWLA